MIQSAGDLRAQIDMRQSVSQLRLGAFDRFDHVEQGDLSRGTGEAVTALSMQERMTLSNMSAELGAQTGLIAPDATTTMSEPAAALQSEPPMTRESEPMIGQVS